MNSDIKKEVQVLVSPAAYETGNPALWSGRIAVIIDVLRATSTMVTALSEGHAWVLPCREVEQAREKARLYPGSILGGERGGLPPEGFSRGNSPLEFTGGAGKGEGIILTTTNGTRAIEAAEGAREIVLGSFLNFSATLDFLKKQDLPVVFVCSGTGEDFALEDALLAGAFLDEWKKDHPIASLYRAYAPRLEEAFHSSRNGRRLVELGLAGDISWCLRRDCYGKIVKRTTGNGWLELCEG